VPNKNDINYTSIKYNILLEGRKQYINNCSSCHNLHLPQEYTKEEWSKILISMQAKANANDSIINLISEYLFEKCKK